MRIVTHTRTHTQEWRRQDSLHRNFGANLLHPRPKWKWKRIVSSGSRRGTGFCMSMGNAPPWMTLWVDRVLQFVTLLWMLCVIMYCVWVDSACLWATRLFGWHYVYIFLFSSWIFCVIGVMCVSGFCMFMGNVPPWMTLWVYIPLQFVNLLCDWCDVCEWILHVYGQRASLDDTMGISCSSVRDSFVCAWCDCYE